MVVKHWPRGPEERASLCGCKYNILCLCHDWSQTKGSDVKQTKTTVPHAHTHSSMCWQRWGGRGSPGSSLHQWQCHYSGHPPYTAGWGWYHGTECQCQRGLSSSVQRVGGSIMNERRGGVGGGIWISSQQQQHSKLWYTLWNTWVPKVTVSMWQIISDHFSNDETWVWRPRVCELNKLPLKYK